jgi:RimJ/RimL family protein N-acetyltransferase
MEQRFQYRRLSPADAPVFRALRLEGLTLDTRAFRSSVEDEAAHPAADRLAEDFWIGAFEGDTLVGVGGLARDSRSRLRHKMVLRGMYISASARGQGAADGIIDRLLDHARAEGAVQVVLTVVADNTRARRVYERHGFTVYGVEPRAVRLDGEYLDEALMCKTL